MSNKTFLKSINSAPLRQKITPKQHEFARLIAEEHLTSSDAYRRAYKPNILAKNKSIHEMACRVMTNIKVQSMIRSIQHKREEDNRMRAIRREEFVLKKLMEEVEKGDQASSRIRALELLGKTVSLTSNLKPSDNGCNNPNVPTTFGPRLLCIAPKIFLSAKVK